MKEVMPTFYTVLVKPSAKKESVEKRSDGSVRVCVRAPADKGKANEEVVRLLAEFFDIPQAHVQIVRGHHSRRKIVSIQAKKITID